MPGMKYTYRDRGQEGYEIGVLDRAYRFQPIMTVNREWFEKCKQSMTLTEMVEERGNGYK